MEGRGDPCQSVCLVVQEFPKVTLHVEPSLLGCRACPEFLGLGATFKEAGGGV